MLLVLRHGQAENNIQERYNSNPDNSSYFVSHLTEVDIQQVRAAGQRLLDQGFSQDTIQRVYVSPLPRTLETASVLQKMGIVKDFIVDHRLIEVNMGSREGCLYNEFPEDSWDHTRAREYHGELDTAVLERVQSLLHEVREKYPNDTVLFITHGTPALELIELCTGKKIQLNPAEYIIIEGC